MGRPSDKKADAKAGAGRDKSGKSEEEWRSFEDEDLAWLYGDKVPEGEHPTKRPRRAPDGMPVATPRKAEIRKPDPVMDHPSLRVEPPSRTLAPELEPDFEPTVVDRAAFSIGDISSSFDIKKMQPDEDEEPGASTLELQEAPTMVDQPPPNLAPPVMPAPTPAPSPSSDRRLWLLLGAVAVGAGLVAYLVVSLIVG